MSFKVKCDLKFNAAKVLAPKVERALEQGGQEWVRQAQQELYPGHGVDTGALRSGLYELTDVPDESGVGLGIYSDRYYAWWIEHGHWVRGHAWFWEGYHYCQIGLQRAWPLIAQRIEAEINA